jgi:hypothetical protein
MFNDPLLVFCVLTFGWFAVFAGWGTYTAERCGVSQLEGIIHAVFLGPFGLLLIALYSRPERDVASSSESSLEWFRQIATDIHWKRQQDEKRLHREKAAQSEAVKRTN